MARTMMEKERAAAAIAERLASRDQSKTDWWDAEPLRRIAEAFVKQVAAEQELVDAVAAARGEGVSWAAIAAMLGVSKQTAQSRYGGRSDQDK